MISPTSARAWLSFSLLLGGLMLLVLALDAIWRGDIVTNKSTHKQQALQDLLAELPRALDISPGSLTPLSDCLSIDTTEHPLRLLEAEGYAGAIEIYVLINAAQRELVLAGFASHNETPGFVDRLSRTWFQRTVRQLNEGIAVDAISGATISSRAVIGALTSCSFALPAKAET